MESRYLLVNSKTKGKNKKFAMKEIVSKICLFIHGIVVDISCTLFM